MNNKQFSVSVIIPVYNGETYLVEAVESIHRQNYEPIEIIIVDDGSTDKTSQIVKNIKGNVNYVYQKNRGPAAARNRGIQLAKSQFLAFLDADDLWPENKLQMQFEHLEKDSFVKIVMGHIQLQCLRLLEGNNKRYHFEKFANPFFTFSFGAGLFRKSVFSKVGLLDESLRYSEDVDWFLRAKEAGTSMITLSQTTLLYRIHEKNMIRKKDIRNRGMLVALKKSINRKREIKD
ncbi:MAG: glycosyltransferase family 2 protein [Planctomycetota bacterium]|jgi:glycosyltransferase involved in cell wall biosynthesis